MLTSNKHTSHADKCVLVKQNFTVPRSSFTREKRARFLPPKWPGSDLKAGSVGVSSPGELLIISLCGARGWVFLDGRLVTPGYLEWSGGFNRVTGAAAF